MYVTMLGLKLMSKERRKSSTEAILINFASIAGLDPMYQAPIYSASKCAVVGFCRAFSVIKLLINFNLFFFFKFSIKFHIF